MTHAIALTRSGPTGGGLDTELEHVSLGVDDSSGGKRPKRFAIAAAALALGATAFVVADPLDSRSGQSVESVVEAPVAAGDLAPGSMYHVVDQIGARALWERGITGAGVNVAVIDTGATPVESLSGDGKIVAVADLSAAAASPSTAVVAGNGHGTHLAAIIAGREPGASPADSAAHPETFLGVAPDSGIVSVKVADRAGDTRQADVIAGIDWVVENSADLDIQVINLAFDSGSPLDYTSDALSAAVERAWNAARGGEIEHTGIMVHEVIEEVDAGPVLGTATVPIDDGMSLADLEAAIHRAEHRLLVEVVAERCLSLRR